MRDPQIKAQESLQKIAEAAKQVVQFRGSRTSVRERTYAQVFEASSDSNLAAKFFSASSAEKTGSLPIDWVNNAAAATLEMRSAQVLFGVAAVRGEVSLPAGTDASEFLSRAIADADNQLAELRSGEWHKGFVGTAQVERLPNLESAFDSFRSMAQNTVSSIVENSESVVSAAFREVSKHGGELVAALQSLAQLISWGDTLTGLVSRAWEKTKSAFQFLSELTSAVQSEELNGYLKRFREVATVRKGLEWIYASEEAQARIAATRLRVGIEQSEVDKDRLEIVEIERRFVGLSKLLKSMTIGLSAIGLVAAHFSGSAALLIIPAGSALVTAATITAGMDFLGKIRLNNDFRGVLQVTASLSTP